MNRHIINFGIFILLNITCLTAYSADGIFDEYYGNLHDSVSADFFTRRPEGFNTLSKKIDFQNILNINPDYMPMDAIAEDQRVVDIPYVLLISDDRECVLFYSRLDQRNPLVHEREIVYEIQVALGDEEVNVTDSIRMITNNDMSLYANADTAYIYNLPLPVPYLDKYTHCTTVRLRKYAHPAALIRIFTTDTGHHRSDEYLRTLLDNVRYGDVVTENGVYAEQMAWDWERHRLEKGPCIHIKEAIGRNKAKKEAERRNSPQNNNQANTLN